MKGKAATPTPSADKEEEAEPVTLSRIEFYYWEIFVEINTQRTVLDDDNPAPLPLADLAGAAVLFDVPQSDYDVFVHVMIALDREYIKLVREDIKKRKEEQARRDKQRRKRGG